MTNKTNAIALTDEEMGMVTGGGTLDQIIIKPIINPLIIEPIKTTEVFHELQETVGPTVTKVWHGIENGAKWFWNHLPWENSKNWIDK